MKWTSSLFRRVIGAHWCFLNSLSCTCATQLDYLDRDFHMGRPRGRCLNGAQLPFPSSRPLSAVMGEEGEGADRSGDGEVSRGRDGEGGE